MDNNDRVVKIVMDFFFLFIAVLFIIFVIPKLVIFFLPIIIGYIIALFANPIVRYLEEKIKLVRKHGSAIVIFLVILGLVLLVYGLIYILISQINNIINELPEFYNKLQYNFRKIEDRYSIYYNKMPNFIKEYCDKLVYGINRSIYSNDFNGKSSLKFAKTTIKNLTAGIIYIIFTIMFAYFFTAERDKLICKMRLLIPGNMVQEMRKVVNNFKNIIGEYIKVQIKIMFILTIVLFIGLLFMKIKYAFLISVVIGVLDFLPLLGIGTILLPWSIFSILLGNYTYAIGLLVLYIICLFIREIAEPKMYGKSLGLGAFSTFFILYFGYKIKGFLGMILAVPISVILVNLYKAGALNALIDDCKYMYIYVDKFYSEAKESIRKEIEKNKGNIIN